MFAEDLLDFFDIDFGFAKRARYDSRVDIAVIIDYEYLETLGVIGGSQTSALVMTSAVDAAPKGKALVVGDVSFTIEGLHLRDDGLTALLTLERVA